MTKFSTALASSIFTIASASMAYAAVYEPQPSEITHISVGAGGEVFIKWNGSPSPGPCGENFGWVVIPPEASEAIKALALSIYFSGKPVRIDTSGCRGTVEVVGTLYSPSG
jgi:hypothetical protein